MKPTNSFVSPLLTDLYQLTMAHAYWKCGRHNDKAVFDLFFRRNPFGGEFSIFAGLEESLRFINDFNFTEKQIRYLESILPDCDSGYFDWLRSLDCGEVKIYAIAEGTIVFPRIPLIRVEGPLGIAQLLETTLLNLVNYASLMITNAARFRIAAGPEKVLLEFGLRRAQGPDGGISASRYSNMGGFNGTSNVLAGSLFGLSVKGTHAHSFVQSYTGLDDLEQGDFFDVQGKKADFIAKVLEVRKELGYEGTNTGELAAFIAYAQAFPRGFLALVDTYDTLYSGVPNFLCVAFALFHFGYTPVGIRLDSGDLAFLSRESRRIFHKAGEESGFAIEECAIVASNDINEPALQSLKQEGHEIDIFGIGTHLVTCQAQPSFGGVYKLVEINGNPRIKLSQDIVKITIPGKKDAYRLIGNEGYPLLDIMVKAGGDKPEAGKKVLCRHPFEEYKRVLVTPCRVDPLLELVWDGQLCSPFIKLEETRKYVLKQLSNFRQDHIRLADPNPYKVSVSDELYGFTHDLWTRESPVPELF